MPQDISRIRRAPTAESQCTLLLIACAFVNLALRRRSRRS